MIFARGRSVVGGKVRARWPIELAALDRTHIEDFESPPAGAVKFSLVAGVTAGIEGSLGTNSAGVTRPNANPCP